MLHVTLSCRKYIIIAKKQSDKQNLNKHLDEESSLNKELLEVMTKYLHVS